MWQYPHIDPVAVSLGPISIHWYGLTYLVGLGLAWWLLTTRSTPHSRWSRDDVSDLVFYGAIGIILGGRVGYMLFYGAADLAQNPLNIFKVWQGGMSFHGGMLGVFAAMYLFGRRHGSGFFAVTDFIAPAVPLGLGMGRLGNFINAELPGRVTEVPWALVYPGDTLGRHPSSVYQFCMEGPLLFLVLYLYSRTRRPPMAVSGMFLVCYGAFRWSTEFFREPDSHLQFVAFGWMTMGQVLSSPMILAGFLLLYLAYTGTGSGIDRPAP